MLKVKEISTDLVVERFCTAFRKYVGPHKKFGITEFAEYTGISIRTIRSYHQGEHSPDYHKLLKIILAIDEPNFTNQLLEIVGYGWVKRLDSKEEYEVSDILVHLLETSTEMVKHNADGKIDHREKIQQKETLGKLIPKLQEYYDSL